jgi:hypothetical protein
VSSTLMLPIFARRAKIGNNKMIAMRSAEG